MSEEEQRYQRALKNDFKSEFLEFENDQSNNGFDIADKLGKRLPYWSPGDNFYTVTWKKMTSRLYWLFNPDTYTSQTKKQFMREAQLHNIQIIIGLIFIIAPLSIAITFIQPRIARAKREFLMHQYDKINMISKALGVKTEKMDFKTLKQFLYKREE